MTYELREKIFSKEVLAIEDIQDLFDMNYQCAADLMRTIKRGLNLSGKGIRLSIQGKLHVQDYLDYFNITNLDRYKEKEKC